VSCPDWSRFAVSRDQLRDQPRDERWADALKHLDACPSCRPEALKADPLLVFRRLPVTDLAPAEERSEAESMRLAVAAMRNAGRLESRHHFAGWRRWTAAAVLALAFLAVSRDRAPHPASGIADAVPSPAPSATSVAEPATIEGLNRPGARVYHMDGKDISVFMIVDESLDV
jgi:hypothetical protein